MLRISTNATDIIDALNVTTTRFMRDGDKLIGNIAKLAKATARGLSTGQKSFQTMRKDGHPYRWGGSAYGAAWRINMHHDHEFLDGWEIKEGIGKGRSKDWSNQHVREGEMSVTYSLVNEATVQYSGDGNKRTGANYKYSDLLAGTLQYYPKKGGGGTWGGMQERPIMDEVYKRIEPKVNQMIREFGQKMGKWEHTPMRSRNPGMGLNRTPL